MHTLVQMKFVEPAKVKNAVCRSHYWLVSLQARLSAAREDWRREMAHSTQVEIERALSTAREAWSLNHKEELDNCASQVEKSLREKLQAKHDEEKRQLVNDALNEAQTKCRAEKRKLEDELSQRKVYRHFFLYMTQIFV